MTEPVTEQPDWDAIQEIVDKATPGPWSSGTECNGNGDEQSWFPFDKGHCIYPPKAEPHEDQPGGPVAMVSDGEYANTPFFIAARTALPAALAERKRLYDALEVEKVRNSFLFLGYSALAKDRRDGCVECRCGKEPYTDGEPCPVCLAIQIVEADKHLTAQGEELLAERKRLAERVEHLESSCPCRQTTPCHPRCTCVNPVSSHGCSRCCRYGSDEQRKQKGERIAALETENERLKRENEQYAMDRKVRLE